MPSASKRIVSLGSSFAAGPSIEPTVDADALRSGRNYAALLAQRLGARHTDLSVSGATTANVLSEPQRPFSARWWQRPAMIAPQVDGIPADADLALLTIGGNDLGYVKSIWTACAAAAFQKSWLAYPLGLWLARGAVADVREADVERVAGEMIKVVEAIRQRAPKARVILIDYLLIIGADSRAGSAELPMASEQLEQCRAIGRGVDRAFAMTAERTGVELFKASELSVDHALGSRQSWITPYPASSDSPMPFHPTLEGMQAIANALYDLVAS